MNYLERLLDEKKQNSYAVERAKKAVEDLTNKGIELDEIIEIISKLERYKGMNE